jgi:hypothetical protein
VVAVSSQVNKLLLHVRDQVKLQMAGLKSRPRKAHSANFAMYQHSVPSQHQDALQFPSIIWPFHLKYSTVSSGNILDSSRDTSAIHIFCSIESRLTTTTCLRDSGAYLAFDHSFKRHNPLRVSSPSLASMGKLQRTLKLRKSYGQSSVTTTMQPFATK